MVTVISSYITDTSRKGQVLEKGLYLGFMIKESL